MFISGPNPGSRIRIFSHPWSGSRIPDPDFFPPWIRIPDSGVKKAPDPGSRSATLLANMWMPRCFFYREGKFKRLGLSNYSAWEVARTMEICAREGWLQPTVYQADRSPAVFFTRGSPARLERPESVWVDRPSSKPLVHFLHLFSMCYSKKKN